MMILYGWPVTAPELSSKFVPNIPAAEARWPTGFIE
jgi:hypothetical protein